MPGSSKRALLPPDQLTDLLAKLQDVMTEAKRLREHVARELVEQRGRLQQRVSTIRRPPRTRKRR
jgi:hypothetical protein